MMQNGFGDTDNLIGSTMRKMQVGYVCVSDRICTCLYSLSLSLSLTHTHTHTFRRREGGRERVGRGRVSKIDTEWHRV
jgi:hypothetical protein